MRNCLTNTKGLVKIEMQINSTKSDSDFSVVHIYRKLQEKISFLLSLDMTKGECWTRRSALRKRAGGTFLADGDCGIVSDRTEPIMRDERIGR